MDHTGTFAHTADRYRLTANLNFNGNLFFYRIRCHDRFCCQCCCFSGIQKQSGKILHAFFDRIDWQLFSDHTGRCYQNLILVDTECFCCRFCSLFTVAISFCSGAGVCDTAVYHNSSRLSMFVYHMLIPFYRCGFYKVCRKRSGCHTWCTAYDHCHIFFCTFFDTCMHTGCFKSFCSGYTSIYYLHLCSRPFSVLWEGLRSRQIQTSGSYSARPDRLHLSPDCPLPPS